MRKKIELICEKCKKSYEKILSKYIRNERLNRKSYCSLKCSANIDKIPLEKRNSFDISQYSNNKVDNWTKFRFYFKLMSLKERKNCQISFEELEEVWNKQNGICPYSNIKLTLSTHTTKDPIFYKRASLDRIDSSKPYTKDNVEFVSLAINYMKNKFSKQETFDFINILKLPPTQDLNLT
jgi:hypothetical protein